MNKWMKRMLLVMDICSASIAAATIVINVKGVKEREGKKFFAWEQGVCLLLDGFVLGAVMQRLASWMSLEPRQRKRKNCPPRGRKAERNLAKRKRREEAVMLYPAIGVPLLGKGVFRRYMQYKYTRCLEKAGASVWLLPWNDTPEAIEVILDRCDGFLFPGGPDIQPQLYGQLAQPSCGIPNPARDAFELALLRGAIEAEKPLFCICRGMQLLNVAFGGTLFQDIKSQQEYAHMDFWHRAYATHPIELDPESLPGKLLESDAVTVNSMHHQAVNQIGDGLWVAAESPEGFPEALEMEGYPFCLAVQWHPEHMAAQTKIQRKLFRAFVDACR